MSEYKFPSLQTPAKLQKNQVLLIANGDLRQSANKQCWPEQAKMEAALSAAIAKLGFEVVRAHAYDPAVENGFIASQKQGMEVFKHIDPDAPLIVAEVVWQYSHHILPGLISHRGPTLTVANWSGTWPGLAGGLSGTGARRRGSHPGRTEAGRPTSECAEPVEQTEDDRHQGQAQAGCHARDPLA